MKKLFLISCLSVFFLSACNKSTSQNTEEGQVVEDSSSVKVKIKVDFEQPIQNKQINFRMTDQESSVYRNYELKDLKKFEETVSFNQSGIFQFQFGKNYIPIVVSLEEKEIQIKINNTDLTKLNYSVLKSNENQYFHTYLENFSQNQKFELSAKLKYLDSISPSYASCEIYYFEISNSYEQYQNEVESIKTKFEGKEYATKLLNLISRKEVGPIKVGSKVPEFLLKSMDGKSYGPQSFKGKYLLLDFWASWCGPCRQEVPNVKRAYDKYKSKGFEVLGVSTDQNDQSWQGAVKQLGMNWTSVRDNTGEVSGIFSIKYIPTVYLISPEGIILAENVRGAALDQLLEKYLSK